MAESPIVTLKTINMCYLYAELPYKRPLPSLLLVLERGNTCIDMTTILLQALRRQKEMDGVKNMHIDL